jgi:hypothetical protein
MRGRVMATLQPQEMPVSSIPETAEDTINKPAEGPGYVGTLHPDENMLLQSLRQSSTRMVLRVGQLEVEKSRIMAQLADMDAQAAAVMRKAAERFGTDGTDWSISQDGKVYSLNPKPEPAGN